MLNSLFSRLTLGLVVVLVLIGALFGATSWYLGKQHLELAIQTFNKDLASNLIDERQLIVNGELDRQMLQTVFAEYMTINPSIEIYLLDTEGGILSYSAPDDKVVMDAVSLGPLQDYLERDAYQPVLGDDPRHPGQGKAFSVAPINTNAGMLGYLYIVLRGEAFLAVERALQHQYVVKLGQRVLLISLLAGLAAGLLILWLITRRLQRLTRKVQAFQPLRSGSSASIDDEKAIRGDEIARLDAAFSSMAARIDRQIQHLEQVDQQRRNMIANVSHDLRTPLAAIHGYLDTIRERGNSLKSAQRDQFIDVAFKNATRLSQLIDELFELARLEAGGVNAEKQPFSLSDLVQDVVQQQKIVASAKGVRIQFDQCRVCPLVYGDIRLLPRVVENLICNAIHHVNRGDEIVVSLEQCGDQVKTRIWDPGQPITDAEAERLFEPYYQGNHRDERYQGSGLGLSIAKQILALHDSAISIENDKSNGKTFSFLLQTA